MIDPTANAVAIVRALAQDCPTKSAYSHFGDGPADYDGEECFFCEIEVSDGLGKTAPASAHEPDCLYRLAVEWDKENPT